jgi:hypothetical protein
MIINRRKLPVKYALEVYQELPGYPSHQDLEYILVWICQEKNLLEKKFTPDNLWSGMRNHLGTLEDLRSFLDYLANPDDPTVAKDFKVKIEKLAENSYKLITHDWV